MEHQVDMINSQSEVVPVIQNVVSTADLGCKLNLSLIALKARNAEYNPKRLTAVVMRIREPKTTALIFSSGKIVCTGAKTAEDSKLATRKYARIIQKLGFPVKFLGFKIQNVVGSSDFKCPINLERMLCKHSKYAIYEPELFPGLVYKMMSPHVSLLVFTSGKVVITGAKKKDDVFQAFQNIYPVLQEVKRTVPNRF